MIRDVFAGAVIAEGQSRQMGRDKALLTVDGERLWRRLVRALQVAGAAVVGVVHQHGQAPLELPRETRLWHDSVIGVAAGGTARRACRLPARMAGGAGHRHALHRRGLVSLAVRALRTEARRDGVGRGRPRRAARSNLSTSRVAGGRTPTAQRQSCLRRIRAAPGTIGARKQRFR